MQRPDIILRRDRFPGEADPDFALTAGLILAIGAGLRFWALGAPSLWTDEMLVVLNASKPWEYIFDLSANAEVHPPYYYFFYKMLLGLGGSDFWLRLPSALCGTLTLLVLWRVGERWLGGRFAALAALCLLAVHPLHIWISRQVRPYAFMGLCVVLGLGALLGYLEGGAGRNARRNLLASLPVALCHYAGLLLLGAQWCVAFLATLVRGVPGVVSLVGYGLGAALCALPVGYFFWLVKFQRREASIETGMGLGPALGKVLAALDGLLAFGAGLPFAWAVPALLLAFGALSLVLRRSVASALVPLFLLPPAMLVIAQYGSHLYAVHLSFLLPVALLLAGEGLDMLSPRLLCRPWFALTLCVALAGAFVGLKGRDYYDPQGVVATWWDMGCFRDLAKVLRTHFTPADMIAFHDLNLFEATDWYAARRGDEGVPAAQRLAPEQQAVRAALVTNYDAFGHLFDGEAGFRALFGESAAVAHVGSYRLYQAVIARAPAIPLEGGGFLAELTADPRDVWARAWSLRDLGVSPYFGCALFPTRERVPGEVIYQFTAAGEDAPRRFNLLADYSLLAPGNRLTLDYRLDDGDWLPLLDAREPAKDAGALLRIEADRPFGRLRLRAALTAGARRAVGGVTALEQVTLKRLTLFAERPDARFLSRTLALREQGLDRLEFLPGGMLWRWGTGEATSLEYSLEEEAPLRLEYRFTNSIPGQRVEVLHDGEQVALHEDLAPGQEVAEAMTLPGRAGQGRVEFHHARRNHQDAEATFAPGDPRALAVRFLDLSLESALPAAPPVEER